MLDDMFSFIDPIIEIHNGDMAQRVIPAEVFFDFLEENNIERPAVLPEDMHAGIPMDIALSLLRPGEMEKLERYVASYMAKHHKG